MRSVFLSDIHGNLAALEAVAADLPQHDEVFVAGDHCLEGPHPAEVWDRLQERGWRLVVGNTDQDIVTPAEDETSKHRDLLDWTREQLGPERIAALAELPFALRGGKDSSVLVVHANPRSTDQHLYPTLSEDQLRPYLEGVAEPVLVFGHLHIPYTRPVLGHLLVDVSSVGHPKDLDRRAAYTVIEWQGEARSVRQVRVPYDIGATIAAYRASGMPGAEQEIDSLLRASY
jgi:diadenosine tetraphosphatase ApaH/serine/threonine PP2A family protein phosphatase